MSNIIPLRGDEYYRIKSEEFFECAMNAIAKEEYEEALQYFENSFQFNPHNQESLMYTGLLYYILSDYKKAISIFQQLYEKDPMNYEYAYRYARGLYEQEELEECITIFKNIPSKNEYYFNSQFYIAKSLHKLKKHTDSVHLLIKLLSEKQSECDIRFELATIYVECFKYKAAILELENCIKINEDYALAYYLLNDLYLELEEKEKAAEIQEKIKDKFKNEVE